MSYSRSDIAFTINEPIIRYPAEHEIFLSFRHDIGAYLFQEWWDEQGRLAFAAWYEQEYVGGDRGKDDNRD